MRCLHPNRQRGVSALEVIVAVLVVGLLSAAVMGSYGAYLDQSQKEETRTRLRQLKLAITEAYRREVMTVSQGSSTAVAFGGVTLANGTAATGELLQPFATYSSVNATQLAHDGFNQPVRVFVSNELNQTVSGVTLRYRVIALVAASRNAAIDSTFNAVTGTLAVAGDDVAEVINGYGIVREVFDDTAKRVERVASAYQSYFQIRYLANPARSIAIDYFANSDPSGSASPSWDESGTVQSSGGAPADATTVGLLAALGLAPADVTTAAGPIQIDNSSTDVNHPNHPTPARTLPPYTARVIAPLPGGEQLVRTVSGTYH